MSKANKICLGNPCDVIPIQIQPLGVAGDIPRHAAQRQPVTVHGAPGARALRRARLRRPVFQHRQHEPQQQQQGPRRPVPAAHLLPAPGGLLRGLWLRPDGPAKVRPRRRRRRTQEPKLGPKASLGASGAASRQAGRQAGRSTPPTFLLSFPEPSCSWAAPEGGNFGSWKTNRTDVAKATRQGATLCNAREMSPGPWSSPKKQAATQEEPLAMPGEWVLGRGAHFTQNQLQCKEYPLQYNAMQCQRNRSRVLLALQMTNLGRNHRAFEGFFPRCNAKAQCLVLGQRMLRLHQGGAGRLKPGGWASIRGVPPKARRLAHPERAAPGDWAWRAGAHWAGALLAA